MGFSGIWGMSEEKKMVEAFFQVDWNTVILPIDHGTAIPVPGLEKTGELIAGIRSEVDGFVVNYGAARAYAAACPARRRGRG